MKIKVLTIIAYNIDYSTLVLDPSIPDEQCHVMEWTDCVGCIHDPKIIRKIELTKYIDIKFHQYIICFSIIDK